MAKKEILNLGALLESQNFTPLYSNEDGSTRVLDPNGQEQDLDVSSLVKSMGVDLSKFNYELNSPDEPINVSPLSLSDRFKMGFGETKDNLSYLKSRYEDAIFDKESESFLVKKNGFWHKADRSGDSPDPYDVSWAQSAKEFGSDVADIIGDSLPIVGNVAGDIAGAVLPIPGGTAIGGSIGAGAGITAKHIMGRYLGTYSGDDREIVKDAALETLMSLGLYGVGYTAVKGAKLLGASAKGGKINQAFKYVADKPGFRHVLSAMDNISNMLSKTASNAGSAGSATVDASTEAIQGMMRLGSGAREDSTNWLLTPGMAKEGMKMFSSVRKEADGSILYRNLAPKLATKVYENAKELARLAYEGLDGKYVAAKDLFEEAAGMPGSKFSFKPSEIGNTMLERLKSFGIVDYVPEQVLTEPTMRKVPVKWGWDTWGRHIDVNAEERALAELEHVAEKAARVGNQEKKWKVTLVENLIPEQIPLSKTARYEINSKVNRLMEEAVALSKLDKRAFGKEAAQQLNTFRQNIDHVYEAVTNSVSPKYASKLKDLHEELRQLVISKMDKPETSRVKDAYEAMNTTWRENIDDVRWLHRATKTKAGTEGFINKIFAESGKAQETKDVVKKLVNLGGPQAVQFANEMRTAHAMLDYSRIIPNYKGYGGLARAAGTAAITFSPGGLFGAVAATTAGSPILQLAASAGKDAAIEGIGAAYQITKEQARESLPRILGMKEFVRRLPVINKQQVLENGLLPQILSLTWQGIGQDQQVRQSIRDKTLERPTIFPVER